MFDLFYKKIIKDRKREIGIRRVQDREKERERERESARERERKRRAGVVKRLKKLSKKRLNCKLMND